MNANPYASATLCAPLPSTHGKFVLEEDSLCGSQVLSLSDHQLESGIRVMEGMLWITEEGDPGDYLIGAGDTFVATRRGRVVIESLTPVSRFVFTLRAA
jgi:hypothetical protein